MAGRGQGGRGRMGSSRLWRAVPITAAGLIALASPAPAQVPPPPENRALESLVGKLPPAPPDAAYNAVVLDRGWLVALGKALFWDTGIGSRSDLACASCHFHAGADPRTKNALDPGLNVQPSADPTFGDATSHLTGSGAQAGPNKQRKPADFPFHRLVDPSNRESAVAYDTNDVTSSAGAFDGTLMTPLGVIKINGKRVDPCGPAVSTIFRLPPAATLNTRRVEPRNTPTMVNAAFMRRNFWDGRASNTFNGVDPFGAASLANDPTARVLQAVGTKPPTLQKLQLPNMSAASQAVGPPLSTNEMACGGRTFADIGRRVIKKAALTGQDVAPDDSVLGVNGPHGSLLNTTRKGLAFVYGELIKKAFQKTYWKAT